NKQDLPNAMNAAEITDKLGLHSLRQRAWVRIAREVGVSVLDNTLTVRPAVHPIDLRHIW
ncbi:UNVERIFIED_CONTAM: ADP-ribosylation factor-like protein, partial [Bacteroidetes bacterium 56_B9]